MILNRSKVNIRTAHVVAWFPSVGSKSVIRGENSRNSSIWMRLFKSTLGEAVEPEFLSSISFWIAFFFR
jgi:hypothetical protein